MIAAVPPAIRERLTQVLNTSLVNFSFCSGGCINHGGKLNTPAGNFFLKWNDRKAFPQMFEAEAKGLTLLRQPAVIDVPEVIAFDEADSFQFLVLAFVEERPKSPSFWETLGRQLAALHQNTSPVFGLDHNNYIGSLKQYNTTSENWIDLFIEQRLDVQLHLALETGKVSREVSRQFQSLYKQLPGLLPQEKPSLLHGDLWSGNLITNSKGNPCLIDPAAYYGHREAEIAFTKLFGGFSDAFYGSYNENFPLVPGHNERSEVYNLYPLMVHVNLFGGGYLPQVVSILRQFV